VRAEQHRSAQIELERIVRDIETLLALELDAQEAQLTKSVDGFSERLAEAQKLAPMPAVRDYQPASFMFSIREVHPLGGAKQSETAPTEPQQAQRASLT
jgi:hypothetical protein